MDRGGSEFTMRLFRTQAGYLHRGPQYLWHSCWGTQCSPVGEKGLLALFEYLLCARPFPQIFL